MTGGISFKAGISDKGPSGEVNPSFSATVSHTSSTTWQGQEYEIIPEWETTRRDFELKGRACWNEGFAWHHDTWIAGYPHYMCAITHDGGWVKLSLPVPPRIALEKSSGNTTAGTEFYYTVAENTTGATRTGNITITAGKDKVTLKFVQSAY